jgi:hypothetical protein
MMSTPVISNSAPSQLSGNRPSRGRRPSKPLKRHPHASCAACPARAKPRHAWLRAATAGCGCVLGTPPSPRANSGRRRGARGCPSEVGSMTSRRDVRHSPPEPDVHVSASPALRFISPRYLCEGNVPFIGTPRLCVFVKANAVSQHDVYGCLQTLVIGVHRGVGKMSSAT